MSGTYANYQTAIFMLRYAISPQILASMYKSGWLMTLCESATGMYEFASEHHGSPLSDRRKCKIWARERRKLPTEWWRKHIYIDEVYLQVGPKHQRSSVQRKPGTTFKERNLAPTFVGDFETVKFFARFSSKGHPQLVPVRQRSGEKPMSPNI